MSLVFPKNCLMATSLLLCVSWACTLPWLVLRVGLLGYRRDKGLLSDVRAMEPLRSCY